MPSVGLLDVYADGRHFVIARTGNALTVNDESVNAELVHVSGKTYSLLLDDKSYEVVLAEGEVYIDGQLVPVTVKDSRTRLIERYGTATESQAGATTTVTAPLPGLVLKVGVKAGDVVEPGQSLLVLEAMKMENELRSPCSSRVTRVHVAVGDAVAKQSLLMELVPTSTDTER